MCESCNTMYGNIGETISIYANFLLFFNICCVKNVRIRIFSVPYFPTFGMWENSDQKNSENFNAVIFWVKITLQQYFSSIGGNPYTLIKKHIWSFV